jgi:hypothetical protein
VESSLGIVLSDDTNLDVFGGHLALEHILQSLDSGVHSVADIHIVGENFLKVSAGLSGSLAESSGLPAVEGARGFDLEKLGALNLVKATDNEADSERSHASRLRVVLEKVCHVLAKHEGAHSVLVLGVVHLDVLAGLEEDLLEVGSNSRVGETHVV